MRSGPRSGPDDGTAERRCSGPMHRSCIVCSMAYRAGVVGGSGYTGAELLRLLAGHPEIEVVHVTADSNAGAAVGALYPSLGGRVPRRSSTRRSTPADLAGLDVAFLALPHGESQQIVPELVDARRRTSSTSGADFRLPAGVYEQWYGQPHTAPELLDRFAFGLPELFRDDVARAPHVAAPGCYPTAAALALAPLVADGLVEPTGIVVDAMSGVSGRGRGLSTRTSLFSEANENVAAYGAAHPPPHRGDGVGARAACVRHRGAGAVHAPPRPDDAGICSRPATPARAVGGLTTASLLERFRAFYAGEPFVSVLDEPPRRRRRSASNAAHVTVRFDERTGSVLALGALDNLGQGRVRAGDPVRQPRCSACPRRPGSPAVGIDAVSVTAAERLRGRRASPAASSRRARPTSRSSPPPTGARCRPPACSRRTSRRRRRAGQPGASRGRARRGGGAQLRERQRGDRRAGPSRRAPDVRARRPTSLGCAPDGRAGVLDRAHRHPAADGAASRPASRELAGDARTAHERSRPPTRS